MPADTHKLSFGEIQRNARQLTKARDEITQQLKGLQRMIDGLVQSNFVTQQASGRFQESYRDWNTGAAKVIEGLQGMSKFLDQAVKAHQDLDRNMSRAASGR